MSDIDSDVLEKADKLLGTKKYAKAASLVNSILKKAPKLEDFPNLSTAALIKGKALIGPLWVRYNNEKLKNPSVKEFRVPFDLFRLAINFDEENEEAIFEIDNMYEKGVVNEEEDKSKIPNEPNHPESIDVLVVGAGASGIGLGIMMTQVFGLDRDRVLLVERGNKVGETFRLWPKEMRFISPSFNQQGWTDSFDLNSIAYGTSPAYTVFSEHPTGQEYADYLSHVAEANELNIRCNTEVVAIRPFADTKGFTIDVVSASTGKSGTIRCRFVVWAAGEFQYQRANTEIFPGSNLCLPNSNVQSWSDLDGNDFVIIGGYESGMDAACNLSRYGKRCSVVSSTAFWNVATDDPSTELAPYTAQRVRDACNSSTPPRLLAPLRIYNVEKKVNNEYVLYAKVVENDTQKNSLEDDVKGKKNGEHRVPIQLIEDKLLTDMDSIIELRTTHPPILCTGFEGSIRLGVVKDLFGWGNFETSEDKEHQGKIKNSVADGNDNRYTSSMKRAIPDENRIHKKKRGTVMNNETNEASKENKEKEFSSCHRNSPLLNEYDESTITPGLFLVGPSVRHKDLSFCFVFKFRQRFGIVAASIAERLGYPIDEAVMKCRDMNMFLDDLSCCQAACGEKC